MQKNAVIRPGNASMSLRTPFATHARTPRAGPGSMPCSVCIISRRKQKKLSLRKYSKLFSACY